MGGHHLADGGRRRDVVQQSERLGGAAGDERERIGHRGAQRLDGRLIADQPERERRHLPHFGIRVGLQQPDERRHAFRQSDAADGDRGAAANARFGSSSRRIKSGGGGGGGNTLRLPCVAGGGTIGIAASRRIR